MVRATQHSIIKNPIPALSFKALSIGLLGAVVPSLSSGISMQSITHNTQFCGVYVTTYKTFKQFRLMNDWSQSQ